MDADIFVSAKKVCGYKNLRIRVDGASLKNYVVIIRLVNFHADANEFKPIKEANDVFSHVRKMIHILKSHRVV